MKPVFICDGTKTTVDRFLFSKVFSRLHPKIIYSIRVPFFYYYFKIVFVSTKCRDVNYCVLFVIEIAFVLSV